jgi:hypothetical protein
MAIDRVEIKDFLVFKGKFAVDFCPGVNVIIGANATGKTTLLRKLYSENVNCVFIPEKDILEHAKGLLPFIEQKQTGFSQIYKNVLINAQDVPTQVQSETQQKVGNMIVDIIGGEVYWDRGEGSFYTMKTDGVRIPFASEASGYKKLGFLGLLVTSGQLEKDAVLLWDEPENSLNPELLPMLVDILLELQRGGVQIFIATHNSNLAQIFDVRRTDRDLLLFCNLSKNNDGTIRCDSAAVYAELPKSVLEDADEALYKAVVAKAMGVDADEFIQKAD